ncbi:MAG: Crp/Fnr family transcriptional regulator [Propionibacteriaceae bacterium]|nr:Crp/Fnr family transcriptional regulator [Propionibacteriaceae bacterium]
MSKPRRTTPLRRSCGHPHECPLELRLRVLSEVPMFAGMEEHLRDIDARMVARGWAGGDYLYLEGDRADALHILAAGRVKVHRTNPEGGETVLDILGPGDLFGGVDSLGVPTHPESVVALETTCTLRITGADFRQLLTDYPEVALRAFTEVSAQLRDSRGAFHAATGTVSQRVAHALLRLAAKFGEPREGGLLIQTPLSRADLAAMTASTTESVSRVMSGLARSGVIQTGRQWTIILDEQHLRDLSGQISGH